MKKKRLVKFCAESTLIRHVNSPLFEGDHELISDFDTECWEVTKKRKKIVDSIAVHISLFIYQVGEVSFSSPM